MSEMQHVLSVDMEAAAERWPDRILEQFEALSDGEEAVLVLDRDPRPLLEVLQSGHAGRYDWSVLEEGPGLWRILVTRHPASDPKAGSAAAYLGWDHDRLDALLSAHAGALASGRMAEAVLRFSEFSTGLRHHIRMEEEVLFPAFERSVGEAGCGPTAVMRLEHRLIESLLERMEAGLSDPAGPTAAIETLRQELLLVLADHNAKEERIVYPLTDLHHPGAERRDLIRRMQAV